MKLKEKLAKESALRNWFKFSRCSKCYLEGFEMAKEMAADEATRFGDEPEAMDIAVRINEMGEEEVDDSTR